MREILFKAKRVDNGEWVEGDLFREIDGTVFIRHIFKPSSNKYSWYILKDEVDPSTVCQYTGLKDWNGEKIFEGDKAKYWNGWTFGNGKTVAKFHEVVFHTIHDASIYIGKKGYQFEIIGNIHNKEQ